MEPEWYTFDEKLPFMGTDIIIFYEGRPEYVRYGGKGRGGGIVIEASDDPFDDVLYTCPSSTKWKYPTTD